MSRLIRGSLGVMFSLLCAVFSFAEEMIPWDSAGKITVYSAQMEQKMNLFREWPGLVDARIYSEGDSQDTAYFLEITYKDQDKVKRVRKTLTSDDVNYYRTAFARNYQKPADTSNDGKAEFLAYTTANSLYYGLTANLMISSATGRYDYPISTGTTLMAGGAGFFIPYLLSLDQPVAKESVSMYRLGSVMGCFQGAAVDLMALNPSFSFNLAMPALFNMAESTAGYFLAQPLGIDFASAELINLGTVGLTGMGLGFVFLFDGYHSPRDAGLTMLLSSTAGLGLSYLGSRFYKPSIGNVKMLSLLTSIGAYTGFSSSMYINTGSYMNNFKANVGLTMGGSALAFTAGVLLMNGQNFEEDLGVIGLAPYAGGLIGSGVGYLIGGYSYDFRATLLMGSLGSLAGWTVVYLANLNKTPQSTKTADKTGSVWNFTVSPESLVAVMMPKGDQNAPKWQGTIAQVSCQF